MHWIVCHWLLWCNCRRRTCNFSTLESCLSFAKGKCSPRPLLDFSLFSPRTLEMWEKILQWDVDEPACGTKVGGRGFKSESVLEESKAGPEATESGVGTKVCLFTEERMCTDHLEKQNSAFWKGTSRWSGPSSHPLVYHQMVPIATSEIPVTDHDYGMLAHTPTCNCSKN